MGQNITFEVGLHDALVSTTSTAATGDVRPLCPFKEEHLCTEGDPSVELFYDATYRLGEEPEAGPRLAGGITRPPRRSRKSSC